MSTELTLKTEKINAKRRELADAMVALFGAYTIKANTYIFAPTFAQMANTLSIDGSLISRLLAPPNLAKPTKNTVSIKSYATPLKIVKALTKQKEVLAESYQKEIELLQQKLDEQVSEIESMKRQKPDKWLKRGIAASLLLFCSFYFFNDGHSQLAHIFSLSTTPDQSAKENLNINLVPETILNPGFEEDEINRAWTHWQNPNLGRPLQVTRVNISQGRTAAKLPRSGERIGYQTIRIAKNTDYILNFNYLMRGSNYGSLTMSILAGGQHKREDIPGATIAHTTVNYQPEYKDQYQMKSLAFNSRNHNEVSIYFYNTDIQCKLEGLELKRKQ